MSYKSKKGKQKQQFPKQRAVQAPANGRLAPYALCRSEAGIQQGMVSFSALCG